MFDVIIYVVVILNVLAAYSRQRYVNKAAERAFKAFPHPSSSFTPDFPRFFLKFFV